MFGIPKICGWLIKLKFNCGKTFFRRRGGEGEARGRIFSLRGRSFSKILPLPPQDGVCNSVLTFISLGISLGISFSSFN